MTKKNDSRYREALSDRSKSAPVLVTEGNDQLAANPDFNYADALQAAVFAQAAYDHKTPLTALLAQLGWSPMTLSSSRLEVSHAYAFAGRREDAQGGVQFALAFEGSNSPFDLVQFRDWTHANLSRYGWSDYYASLQPLMARVLREALTARDQGQDVELVIAGHSLGGAAASVALADLFLPPQGPLWPDSSAPLQAKSRIYNHPELAKWTPEQIRSLLPDTQAYVFGAPSFLIDPNKFDALGWLKFGLSLINPAGVLDFFLNLGKNVAEVVIVNEARQPNLAGIEAQLFQFEHRNSEVLLGLGKDPVAALGSRQAGTTVALNLDDAAYQRYGSNPLSLHSMDHYAQTLMRVVAGEPVLRAQDPFVDSSLLLPRFSNGTPRSDMIVDVLKAAGLDGHDLLMAHSAGTYTLNGGTGQDVYVIAGYGVEATISGPADEGIDHLYFALAGQLSVEQVEGDWVFTLTGTQPGEASSVRVETDNGYDVDLVGTLVRSASDDWTLVPFV